MSARDSKQLVYRYNGVATSDEIVVDHDGDIEAPQQNDILTRQGKVWKAVHVIWETATDGRWPVVRVSLTDQF